MRASQRRWLEPIGQNRYVWRAGTRGRIRIRFWFAYVKMQRVALQLLKKKSGIGAVLSELDSFEELSV